MKRSLKSSIKSLNILGILLAFLVLCVIMAIASPAFLKQTNLLNILQQISINFTIAIGMTFVILIGGIDLSVGSITALTGMFVAIMMKNWNIPVAPAIIIAVLSASLLGLINGVLISGLDLPPFIVTLGMMELARGMSYTVTAGQPIYTLPAGFLAISGRVRGIPLVALLIMIALFVLAYYVLHFTRIGRYVYAVGGNEKVSFIAGIKIERVKIFVYAITGFFCALAGAVLTSRLNSAQPTAGTGYELDAIAAVVLGGTSLSGGKGYITGTLVGVLIIGTLNNGLNILDVSSFYQQVVKGIVILLAVLMDRKKA